MPRVSRIEPAGAGVCFASERMTRKQKPRLPHTRQPLLYMPADDDSVSECSQLLRGQPEKEALCQIQLFRIHIAQQLRNVPPLCVVILHAAYPACAAVSCWQLLHLLAFKKDTMGQLVADLSFAASADAAKNADSRSGSASAPAVLFSVLIRRSQCRPGRW